MSDDTYIHLLCPQYGAAEVEQMRAAEQAEIARLQAELAECKALLAEERAVTAALHALCAALGTSDADIMAAGVVADAVHAHREQARAQQEAKHEHD